MTKKYIIDEWDVVEIIRCAEKAEDKQLASFFRLLKPVEPIPFAEMLAVLMMVDSTTKRLPPGFIEFARAIESYHFGELK